MFFATDSIRTIVELFDSPLNFGGEKYKIFIPHKQETGEHI